MSENKKARLATIWLDGCSGCHMSLLDMDERLIEVYELADIVYSPYVDTKEYPKDVDICVVEGSISSDHDVKIIKQIRENTKTIVALGDCAITGNISAMKNLYGTEEVMRRGYYDNADINKGVYPDEVIPKLLDTVHPVHEIVKVDYFIPGCPTPADAIYDAIISLINGKEPNKELTRFGK